MILDLQSQGEESVDTLADQVGHGHLAAARELVQDDFEDLERLEAMDATTLPCRIRSQGVTVPDLRPVTRGQESDQ